jgi:hypothetical protein
MNALLQDLTAFSFAQSNLYPLFLAAPGWHAQRTCKATESRKQSI